MHCGSGRRGAGRDVDARKIDILKSGCVPIDTDHLRVEPSQIMIETLWSMGASISVYDLAAMDETRRICGDCADIAMVGPMDALDGTDVLLIATE